LKTRIISFEGCIGAGKTSLANYFSKEFGYITILEDYEKNPFLQQFYVDGDVNFETELSFLLIHYSQLKQFVESKTTKCAISDFSIEKDYIFAELNLRDIELKLFKQIYEYVSRQVGIPELVIYLDISLDVLRKRISKRGRSYELDADLAYFKKYNDKSKEYFKKRAGNKVYFVNTDDLEFDQRNQKLLEIRDIIVGLR
jgi:deoxyguanosine kinase